MIYDTKSLLTREFTVSDCELQRVYRCQRSLGCKDLLLSDLRILRRRLPEVPTSCTFISPRLYLGTPVFLANPPFQALHAVALRDHKQNFTCLLRVGNRQILLFSFVFVVVSYLIDCKHFGNGNKASSKVKGGRRI